MTKNNFYKNKIILVTGGAGSIGSEIVKRLLKYNPRVIRVLDNNETGLFDLGQEIQSKKLRLFIGDIRDEERLRMAAKDVDIIFHSAALKHVPLCEYNPFDAVKTNVIGTKNVINAALAAQVEKVVNISTDKAVNPVSVMGATKLLAERLIISANYYKGKTRTVFSSVRFGNVLNSRGSVLPLLQGQIKKGGPATITNPEMTRFIMPTSRAVDLVLKAAEIANDGEIFIFKMPAVHLNDLIKAAIEIFGPMYGYKSSQIEMKVIGERAGEKIHEELMTEDEAKNAYETKEMFVILPKIIKKGKTKKHFLKRSYSSKNIPRLDKSEIKNLLKKELKPLQ